MSSNIFSCCVYRAAEVTLNDFTWTHCASGLFNTVWFIYMLLLIGLIFSTLTKQEKTYLKPRCTLHTVSWKNVIQPENRSKTAPVDLCGAGFWTNEDSYGRSYPV